MTEQQALFYGEMFQKLMLTELEVEIDGTRLCLKKQPGFVQNNDVVHLEKQPDVPSDNGNSIVKAPLLGIFHRAPSPNEDAFVEEGDMVKKGDILCIIEAMKMMNEITADNDGIVAAICAEENKIVEYGQKIFEIKQVLGNGVNP